MKITNSRLSRKLLVFIFSVSFVLISGSFIYFYFSAETFLLKSGQEELNIYHKYFEQAASSQLKEYSYEINGAVIDGLLNSEESIVKETSLINFVRLVSNLGEEFYFYEKQSNKTYLITPIKVFGGEQVLNPTIINNQQFTNLSNSIKLIKKIDESTFFSFSVTNSFNDFFLTKELQNFIIIIKLSTSSLFYRLTEKVYFPPKINFSIISRYNVFEYSTNKFWVNQRFEKYLQGNLKQNNSFFNEKKEILYQKWGNKFFNSDLLISNDLSKEYENFYEIIYKVLFYSILIYFLINIVALIYVNKLSISLNEISEVTKKIGEGKFNTKINIFRKDEVGELIESFNSMVDKLKDSYNKINSTNKELEIKIKELSETKNELTKKQKLALIGETISKISHEIQNKISGVSVWIQNLEMQTSLDKNTEIYVNEIKQSLNSFVEMLYNFKKFYRKPYLEKSNFSLVDLIEMIISRYKNDTEAKKINVLFNNSDVNQINADKNLIEEAIANLFVNAIYFSPKDGNIKIETKLENEYMIFSIQNQGPNIDEENLENIFNPFFTTKSSGSGLGLAICKNIIEAHNGAIKVLNLKPNGIKFEFYLPLISES